MALILQEIILKVTKFPRLSTPASLYYSHLHEIIASFTNSILCYTGRLQNQ